MDPLSAGTSLQAPIRPGTPEIWQAGRRHQRRLPSHHEREKVRIKLLWEVPICILQVSKILVGELVSRLIGAAAAPRTPHNQHLPLPAGPVNAGKTGTSTRIACVGPSARTAENSFHGQFGGGGGGGDPGALHCGNSLPERTFLSQLSVACGEWSRGEAREGSSGG